MGARMMARRAGAWVGGGAVEWKPKTLGMRVGDGVWVEVEGEDGALGLKPKTLGIRVGEVEGEDGPVEELVGGEGVGGVEADEDGFGEVETEGDEVDEIEVDEDEDEVDEGEVSVAPEIGVLELDGGEVEGADVLELGPESILVVEEKAVREDADRVVIELEDAVVRSFCIMTLLMRQTTRLLSWVAVTPVTLTDGTSVRRGLLLHQLEFVPVAVYEEVCK